MADSIALLREEKQDLLMEDADRAGTRNQIDELEAFLHRQNTEISDYDEALIRKLLKKVTVFDDRLVFEFKSGVETEVYI